MSVVEVSMSVVEVVYLHTCSMFRQESYNGTKCRNIVDWPVAD